MSATRFAIQAVGRILADKLSRAMAPATIRVPLARRERAMSYRALGMSNAMIARKLGITENGVGKLFGREQDLPDRPGSAKHDRQLNLF
jgi:DNA-binding NarL/FixJ family response regulator